MRLRRSFGRNNRQEVDEDGREKTSEGNNVRLSDAENTIVVRDGGDRCVMEGSTGQAAAIVPQGEPGVVGESELEHAFSSVTSKESQPKISLSRSKPPDAGRFGMQCVLLGHWRESTVPDDSKKHAVTGFVDEQNTLQMYIQPYTKEGEPLAQDYGLPARHSERWVTFDRVEFSHHLVGLNPLEVKEYTRIRSNIPAEESKEERIAAEAAAVADATHRAKIKTPLHPAQPAFNGGRTSNGFKPILPALPKIQYQVTPSPQKSIPTSKTQLHSRPLPCARPTRIPVGCWKPPGENNHDGCHEVYGILGQNDSFRYMVVQEIRDRGFENSNVLSGASAIWISFEEVEFLPHLKVLNHQEVKEFCRIRQNQVDHGENPRESTNNEANAVREAQLRVSDMSNRQRQNSNAMLTARSRDGIVDLTNKEPDCGNHLPPTNRDTSRPLPNRRTENDLRASGSCITKTAVQTKSQPSQVGQEPVRAETTLDQPESFAVHKEQIPASIDHGPGKRAPPDETSSQSSEHPQRSDKRQRTLSTEEECREYVQLTGGMKFHRKTAGPFAGKFVSQGAIFNMNGDDYIEYRVLAKVSFL